MDFRVFEWKGAQYLLIVHYFSRWIEIALLKHTSSSKVTRNHFLPDTVSLKQSSPTMDHNIPRVNLSFPISMVLNTAPAVHDTHKEMEKQRERCKQ